MGENSKIEWTDHTFNPWRGCTKVSPGCANCYAERQSKRNPEVLGIWGDKGTRVGASDAKWREPLTWDRAVREAGERHRVFCASMADVFEDREDVRGHRWRLFRLIRDTPNLDWLLLTKRPQFIAREIEAYARFLDGFTNFEDREQCLTWARNWLEGKPPANVWLGTSVENQAAADERIPHLLSVPAAVRFLSMEPLLGPVDLDRWLNPECGHCEAHAWVDNVCGSWHCASCESARPRILDWVIVGGESGPGARPMDPRWARSLRQQCNAAGVPFFFKQHGEWCKANMAGPDAKFDRVPHHEFDADNVVWRVGKKAAGRLLDGRTWDEFPQLMEVTTR